MQAEVMWRLIHNPTTATIDDVLLLLFMERSDPKRRYYISGVSQADLQPLQHEESTSTPLQRIQSLLSQRNNIQRPPPQALLPSDDDDADFVPFQAFEDRTSDKTLQMVPCPPTIDEAMHIVSMVRKQLATHPAAQSHREEYTQRKQLHGHEVFD